MSKTLTTDEKIISFLIAEYNKGDNSTNEINISKADIENIGITESEASRAVQLLESSGYFTIKIKSIHNDFSRFWTVIINKSCINYFIDKQDSSKEKRRKSFEEFRAWITLLISIFAFGLSVFALYLQNLSK